MPGSAVRERMTGLEARKANLEQALAEAVAPAPRLHGGLAEIYRVRVAELAKALASEDAAEARELTRGLVEEIRLVPGDGRLGVEVRGALGGILRLAEGARAGAGAEDLARQVKLVAGTGFEPVTFRL
jgi:site-specific DNA recombinase